MVSALTMSAVWAAGCSTGHAASDARGLTSARPAAGPGQTTVRVLQLNLCNSGRADCYTGGRAVTTAVSVIGRSRPDLVSVNEICRDDVAVLRRTLAAVTHGGVATTFRAAQDGPTGAPVRCRDGQEFGDGLLASVPDAAGVRSSGGRYTRQDPGDVEERVWACLDLTARLSACTSHLASRSPTVALDQCRYLLGPELRAARGQAAGDRVVVAGDFNLAARGAPNPQACVPPGYRRADDGALQDVVAGPGVTVAARSVIDMRGTTDHPGLLVDLVLPAGS
jgi:hypothetical protein